MSRHVKNASAFYAFAAAGLGGRIGGAAALMAILGYRQIDLLAKVLMLLVLAEFAIVLVLDVAILIAGGDAGLNQQPFAWSQITPGTPSIGTLFCFAAFIGFEATTIYAEEAKTPRTVPRAPCHLLFRARYRVIQHSDGVADGHGRRRRRAQADANAAGPTRSSHVPV